VLELELEQQHPAPRKEANWQLASKWQVARRLVGEGGCARQDANEKKRMAAELEDLV
jgi:hypothetical protein